MRRAFLDTTILTNVLLKPQKEGKAARAAINKFDETLLPQYAIKEFKSGPLRAYVWFYNKVLSCASWAEAVSAIPLLFMQKNKQSTVLNALVQFETSISKSLPADFMQKYPRQSMNQIMREEAAMWLKTRIFLAWNRRHKIASRTVSPLSCYLEIDLKTENSGMIDDKPVVCGAEDCCLREKFVGTPNDTKNLLKACDRLPAKAETEKRRRALKELDRLPNRPLTEKNCKALGDAVFAIQCPKDAIILTTNVQDHQPLARAVGVDAVPP